MKIRKQRLLIGSSIAVVVGIVLWTVVGPAEVRAGIVSVSTDHEWSFFRAYGWLSGSEPPPIEVTATYWVGIAICWIGLSIFVGGVAGILLALVRAKGQTQIRE